MCDASFTNSSNRNKHERVHQLEGHVIPQDNSDGYRRIKKIHLPPAVQQQLDPQQKQDQVQKQPEQMQQQISPQPAQQQSYDGPSDEESESEHEEDIVEQAPRQRPSTSVQHMLEAAAAVAAAEDAANTKNVLATIIQSAPAVPTLATLAPPNTGTNSSSSNNDNKIITDLQPVFEPAPNDTSPTPPSPSLSSETSKVSRRKSPPTRSLCVSDAGPPRTNKPPSMASSDDDADRAGQTGITNFGQHNATFKVAA